MLRESKTCLPPRDKKSTSSLPRNENRNDKRESTASSRKQQQLKKSLIRSKKLFQAKVLNKLIESQSGRNLLLGRALFKERQKRLQQQQEKKSIIRNDNNSLSSSSSFDDDDVETNDQYANSLIQKYLENRAIRRSVAMKKRKEDIEKLAFTLNNDSSLSSMMRTNIVKNLFTEEKPKKSLSSLSYHISLDKAHYPSRPLILQSKAA